MNSTKRFFLGLVSSLLLAVGFVRAADRFDPVSRALPSINENLQLNATAADTHTECWADFDKR
jgi:hypothetical protein